MTAFRLTDESGAARESFATGETVLVAGAGVLPGALYEFHLDTGASSGLLLASLCADRHGTLPPTVLLPYLGLTERGSDGRIQHRSFDEATRAGDVRTMTIHAGLAGKREATLKLAVVATGKHPQIMASDAKGRLLTGCVRGESDVFVSLRNFPDRCVRVFLVPRQFRWRAGDPINPARRRDGSPVSFTARVPADGRLVQRLWSREEIRPGNYQLIARSFVPGWFEADADRLLPEDVLSGERTSALVVRLPGDNRIFENGVVLTPEISGHPLSHPPYFRFTNNFPKGTDVWAAIDPDALPPGLQSQRAAIYVIKHKSAAQWNASNALADVSGPGGTAAVKVVPIVPGCVNWNETLVWPNPQDEGKYDIVVDFGNNAADPAQFATDAKLDAPLDMIDGYVRFGFQVTLDPSLPGPFAGAIGQHSYDLGSVAVPKTDAGPTPTDTIPVRAVVRYPAQANGVDAAFQPGIFPLIVIMHGNSGMDTSYLGYNYLLDHLAGHGFVAMSIHVPPSVFIETRARAILHHLSVMSQNNASPGLFHNHVDFARVGIAGHSRGGESVVRAARINTSEGLGWNIKAAVSIAPTDYFHYGDPGVPLLVIYGSNDGDVSGAWPDRTCFVIYDEAGRPRSFVFVYGGTHDRFNTEWASIEANVEMKLEIAPGDIPNLISLTDHENVAKGYATAFFRAHLQGKQEQLEYFSTSLKPALVSGLRIHTSHQEPGSLLLDNFEQHNVGQNSLGGSVTTASLLAAPGEDQLHVLDQHSPHVTSGGSISWSGLAGAYRSTVPAANKDVSGFRVLSFRVTQKYGSASNPANQAQDFSVRLTDLNNKSRAIRVGVFTDIPYPYERGFATRIKSALKTIRIPLESYTIANLGKQDVDLKALKTVAFEFASTSSGEVEIDDVEFTT